MNADGSVNIYPLLEIREMRKANLRFKDGNIVTVELTQRHQVRPVSNRFEKTPSPLIEWPHVLRYTRKRREDFRLLSRPPYDVQMVDDVAEFHIDRASFDPDRRWQNYLEAE